MNKEINFIISLKTIVFFLIIIFMIILAGVVYSSISYKVSSIPKFIIKEDEIIVESPMKMKDNVTIESPLIIQAPIILVDDMPTIDANYSVCLLFNKPGNKCDEWCVLIIKKGLITGCVQNEDIN